MAIRSFSAALVGLWLLLNALAAQALPRHDYWLLDQFLARHPEQVSLTRDFTRRVEASPVALAVAQERPVRIVAIFPGNQISDYWRLATDALTHRLTQLGIDYQLNTYFSRPQTQVELQEQQLVEALSADPDYLIYTLDGSRQVRSIERILARGRPKVMLQNITTPIRAWEGNPPMMYLGFDHHQGSRLLADSLLRREAPPRRFSVLFRDRGYISDARGDTFIESLRAEGLEPLSTYYTRADRATARIAALDALERHPDLDFIYACSTDVALGAVDAIKELGRQETVAVNGWGGGIVELQALARGELALTVLRINDDNGIAMAEAIASDLRGQPVPRVFAGRLSVVTTEDSPEAIEALRREAFRATLFRN